MPTPQAISLFPPELQRALGAEGETEYRQLLRVVRAARGSFFLFCIESDFSPTLRDALLHCLRADLAESGMRLRRAALSAHCSDLFALPELETPVCPGEALVLLGIEDTPGIVPEPGRKPERPPSLALLNHMRETLHARLPAPLIVWCMPYAYTALQQYAPDFFDHYAGLFQFMNAAPAPAPERLPSSINTYLLSPPAIVSPASVRSAIAFYEEQITQRLEPTPERARALLGLADALLQRHGSDYNRHIQRAQHVIEEALSLLSPEHSSYQWARGQGIKGLIYTHLPLGDHVQNLQHAVGCLTASLRVYTEVAFPQEWAATQTNLGVVYLELRERDLARNIEQAINHFTAALRVYTESDFSQQWASVQNNMGNAYLGPSRHIIQAGILTSHFFRVILAHVSKYNTRRSL